MPIGSSHVLLRFSKNGAVFTRPLIKSHANRQLACFIEKPAMASTSAPRGGAASRIKLASNTLSSDDQTIFADVRKALNLMKEVAVEMEKEKKFQMVKELEDGFVELLEASEGYAHFSSAVQSVGNIYQPQAELTDFEKLFENEVVKFKANSSSAVQNRSSLRQFKEAVWNVHHAGQPMPGEEQEDIVMTTSQSTLLNVKCPLTGKPITELMNPVRSIHCKHIYEKKAILQYIKSNAHCPVAGCPKMVQADKVICDPMLPVEIDEWRSLSRTEGTEVIEDVTNLDEEDLS